MIPILYTDSDQVLSTIGLTPDDISDEVLNSKDLEKVLSVDLYQWLSTHSTIFKSTTAVATSAERFQSDCLELYCTYFCAAKVLEMALLIFMKESDGQNEYNRFGSLDFNRLKAEVMQQAGYYRQTLLTALSSETAAVRVPQFTVVAPSYDPVTG